MACCWARLGDPEKAAAAINGVVARNHPNFFCGQGKIFQIDGNLGATAGERAEAGVTQCREDIGGAASGEPGEVANLIQKFLVENS